MSDDVVPITSDLKRKLISEKTRTGISAITLLEGETDIPAGLTSRTINRWLGGLSKSASRAHLDYALVKWAQYEDDAKSFYIVPDDAMLVDLQSEFARVKLTPTQFVECLKNCPNGISGVVISRWLDQRTKSINARLWNFVLGEIKALPNWDGPQVPPRPRETAAWALGRLGRTEYRAISEREWSELNSLRQCTGMSGYKILRDAMDVPEGLNSSMVSAWIGGQTRTAKPDHIDYVLERYRAAHQKQS